ncbi:MAG: hypothetical protein CW345_10120 [Firmicutes bacterium]|nr:hypothetical protein [Bacillota bacterium]MBO2522133.1 hypothetical protein [Bacillota bacterium]
MSKCRLMVVDDDPAMRQVLRDFIELFLDDYEIIAEAANGRDAVRLAAETDPDVILMDVRMPLEDGIQATRRIKQELGLRAVVITSTTYAWNEIRYEAYRAGASLHLPKPFDLERLKRVLHDAHVLAKRPPAEPDERLGWAAK